MFEFEPGLMIWTSISFAILVYLMYKLAFPPLLAILREREKLITDSINQADERQKNSLNVLSAAHKRLADAELTTKKMIETAKKEGEDLKQDILMSARREAEIAIVRGKEELRLEKEKIVSDLKRQTADLVVDASGKLLRQKIDKDKDAEIIKEALRSCQR